MAIKNAYQRKASSMGRYNKSLYDAMAEENIGNIRMKSITEQTERYSNLIDTGASYISYKEAKVARDKTLEDRKTGFEVMQVTDTDATYGYNKTSVRDWLSGEAKFKDINKETYTRDGKEIDTGTLDAFYEKTAEHEVANILGLKVKEENNISDMRKQFEESGKELIETNNIQHFGNREGFDMGDIFGNESIYNVWNKRKEKRKKRKSVMNYTGGTGIL
jgi:hypothetical protein|tara:strand:+ start:4118 stop:4774 length:657 start_codon:yes stop_codon:yes gene_type:complete